MTDKHDYDDLEDEFLDDEEDGSFLGVMSVLRGFLAIVGFITLAWYAYRTGTESLQVEELEVVKADSSPLKQAPEDPGGWKFPHQDKTIYETISSRKQGGSDVAEKTAPAPEEPLSRSEKSAGSDNNMTAGSMTADKNGQQAQKVQEITKVHTAPAVEEIGKKIDKEAVGKSLEKAEKIAAETTAKELAAKEPAANKPTPAAVEEKQKAVATGKKQFSPPKSEKKPERKIASRGKADSKVRLQLGAFKSRDEAESSWQKISSKHKALLSGLSPKINRADLGKKGVFYRLQLVPFAQANDARKLCDKLASRKQPCFVVMAQ